MAERPTARIPTACNGWAETQAAYRLLSGDHYNWMDILEPHRQCTRARMAPHPVVLCLQDTTELDFKGQAIAGLGPLSDEAQRGRYLPPTFAVSPAREPLGVLDAWMWARAPKAADGTRPGVKESLRWMECYARVEELAAELPETRLVSVADREADIREPIATMKRIERALALFLVVAWRIARLMRLGRTVPELDAALLLEPKEWQAAYILAKQPLPKQPRAASDRPTGRLPRARGRRRARREDPLARPSACHGLRPRDQIRQAGS